VHAMDMSRGGAQRETLLQTPERSTLRLALELGSQSGPRPQPRSVAKCGSHGWSQGLLPRHHTCGDPLNSAFLDTEVLHRTLQSSAPHSSACSSAALASASSAASGSLRDACFSASDIASFIVRIVLSLLHQPPHDIHVPDSPSVHRSDVLNAISMAASHESGECTHLTPCSAIASIAHCSACLATSTLRCLCRSLRSRSLSCFVLPPPAG
jgi:hypothetical protein